MQKINFKNLPDTSTPLNAENLNLMQDNIETAINTIELMGGGDEVGTVKMFSGSTAPQGWLICDGSAISRSEYAELFSAIGTTYGSGNGTTTFNIPNIKGRTVVGLDSNDTDFNTLGNTLGEKTHTLTIDEMPSHNHNVYLNGGSLASGTGRLNWQANTAQKFDGAVEATGGGQSHNIMQPSIVLNYIIKASATTTTQGQIIDSLSGDSTTNAPSVHAVKEKIAENVTTDGVAVKTGRTIDNKTEYIKRFSFTRTSSDTQTVSKNLGFVLGNVIITKIDGTGISNSSNWFNANLGDYLQNTGFANKIQLLNSSNTVEVEININFDTVYVEICYINKN